jgi:hypothetical protein
VARFGKKPPRLPTLCWPIHTGREYTVRRSDNSDVCGPNGKLEAFVMEDTVPTLSELMDRCYDAEPRWFVHLPQQLVRRFARKLLQALEFLDSWR